MTDFLFYAKIVLLVVLLYDVGILFRKPEEGSKVAKLDFWTEMERKGIESFSARPPIFQQQPCCMTSERPQPRQLWPTSLRK